MMRAETRIQKTQKTTTQCKRLLLLTLSVHFHNLNAIIFASIFFFLPRPKVVGSVNFINLM